MRGPQGSGPRISAWRYPGRGVRGISAASIAESESRAAVTAAFASAPSGRSRNNEGPDVWARRDAPGTARAPIARPAWIRESTLRRNGGINDLPFRANHHRQPIPRPPAAYHENKNAPLWNQSAARPARLWTRRTMRGHFILMGERCPVIDDLFFQDRPTASNRLRRRWLCFFEHSGARTRRPAKALTRKPFNGAF